MEDSPIEGCALSGLHGPLGSVSAPAHARISGVKHDSSASWRASVVASDRDQEGADVSTAPPHIRLARAHEGWGAMSHLSSRRASVHVSQRAACPSLLQVFLWATRLWQVIEPREELMHQHHHRTLDCRAHMRDGAQCPTSPLEGPACTSVDVLRVRPHCKSSCGNGVQSMPLPDHSVCPSVPSLPLGMLPPPPPTARAASAPLAPLSPCAHEAPRAPCALAPQTERERDRGCSSPAAQPLHQSLWQQRHARARELHATEELPAFAENRDANDTATCIAAAMILSCPPL